MYTIIDTDIASGVRGGDVDDALALLLAFLSRRLNVIGLTIVHGNVDLKAMLAAKVLRVAGVRVPIVKGVSKPLTGMLRRGAQEGFGELYVNLSDVRGLSFGSDAPRYIIEKAREYGSIRIITLGPLTNIALALTLDSELIDFIEAVYVMGGVFNNFLDGRILPIREYNVASDPIAARIVFSSGLKYTLIPLDVTLRVYITRSDIEVFRNVKTKVTKYVLNLLSFGELWYLHDPLTVGVAIDRGFVKTVRGKVNVVIGGELSGMTYATKGEPQGEICVDVKAKEFKKYFLTTIFSG